jgi:hypothetical protein
MTDGVLAFGEHDALGVGQDGAADLLQEAGGGIQALGQAGAVGVHVGDRLAGHAGVHGRLGDERRHVPDQARVEGRGDDVLRAELQLAAVIGGGDLVGHVLAGQHGQGVGAGDLHLVIDAAGPHVQGAAEDVGEAQDVVDLVGIVAAAGAHDRVLADRVDLFRGDLRVGVGHGEDDRVGGHAGDHLGREGALGDRPSRTSAPTTASARVRSGVSTAWALFHWFMPSVRPW